MPRDLLELARGKRERLLAEVAELDRFIAAGEALRAGEPDEALEEITADETVAAKASAEVAGESPADMGAETDAETAAGADRAVRGEGEPLAGDETASNGSETQIAQAETAPEGDNVSAPKDLSKKKKQKGAGGRAAASTRPAKGATGAKKASPSEAPARRSRDQIIGDAQALSAFLRQQLSESSGPVSTPALLERASASGHHIGGQKPLSSLAAKLSRSSEFANVPGEGWTLVDQPGGDGAKAAPGDESSARDAGEPRPEMIGGEVAETPASGAESAESPDLR